MNLTRNLSMRGKLLALVLPALLAILYFAADVIRPHYQILQSMDELNAIVQLAEIGAPLTEALQKERGRSAVVIASAANTSQAQQATRHLADQRHQTDLRMTDYRKQIQGLVGETSLDDAMLADIRDFERQLDDLTSLRQSIDSGSLTASESARRYTIMIMGLINRLPLVIQRSSNADLTRKVVAYSALAEATEMAGRERAAGASLIRDGEFALPAVQSIASLGGQQEAFLHEAQAPLEDDSQIRQALEDFTMAPANRNLQAQRDTLFNSPSGMLALNADDWFDAATGRIERLSAIGSTMLAELHSFSVNSLSEAKAGLVRASGIALAAIVLVLALVLLTTRTISRQVHYLMTAVKSAIDNKDLTNKLSITSKDELGIISKAINDLFGRFGNALQHIDKASVQLATATEETSSTAVQNTGQVKNQQQQIEQIAAATEEMSATSEEISRNTQQVADAASSAMEKSRTGEEVLHGSVRRIRSLATSVQEVNDVIEELERRSGTINDVVDVIRQVADQTNLLALNAAIEAARAGEYGRGFAVVADEVRTLARQTHESTTKIEDIINGFKDVTDSASRSIIASHKLANETSEQASELEQTFADILSDVNGISDMASQIATAAEEQVSVTRELAGNMESVSEAAILTLTGSQEITQVTGEQAQLARALQDLSNEFKVPAYN